MQTIGCCYLARYSHPGSFTSTHFKGRRDVAPPESRCVGSGLNTDQARTVPVPREVCDGGDDERCLTTPGVATGVGPELHLAGGQRHV